MRSYLILGAGKFGRLALARLSACDPAARFVIVDQNPAALEALPSDGERRVERIAAEVTTFLREHLANFASWDWLIPMMPVHVALARLMAEPAALDWEIMAAPQEVESLAPSAVRGPQGEVYLSRATHLCPDDCPAPEDFCPVTGESRTPALYEELAAMDLSGFQIIVMASRQLAPGVGGYPPGELAALPTEIAEIHSNLLIATACRCHGVVHALRRRKGQSR
ncbi:MAG: hypothetical protein QME75_08335 [Deltaproteobacteria bacterium]|nr:hypothetical protein [Deltaproteobacteria bacterium]